MLDELEGKRIFIPEVWGVEVANGIAMGERRKRLKATDVEEFLTLLAALEFVEERRSAVTGIGALLSTTRQHDLTAYDASYFALAIRLGAALATLDAKLTPSAKAAGISIFGRLRV